MDTQVRELCYWVSGAGGVLSGIPGSTDSIPVAFGPHLGNQKFPQMFPSAPRDGAAHLRIPGLVLCSHACPLLETGREPHLECHQVTLSTLSVVP